MEQSQSNKIRYTVQYYSSVPGSVPAAHPIHTISRNEPPLELRRIIQEDGANPVIEIVTAVDAVNGGGVGISLDKLDIRHAINIRGTHMIIHSETLSQTIRDVVQFYAGQNLTGTSLTIREPYACLMHHMIGFELLTASDRGPTELEHVQILVEFLRPRYQQQYIPAKERSLTIQPTVRFEDLWVVMKPGSLAYTCWNSHTIGCVIGKSVLLPPEPSHDLPERWSIDFWFLQVHWPSDQIGFNLQTAVVDRFDGEKPVTSLPIHPAEYVDAKDQGKTKQRFMARGRKVCDILWGESRYMEYDGECMDRSKHSFTGRIIVAGPDVIEEAYPKHDWKFSWVPPSQLMKKDSDVPLSEIDHMVNPKTDHRDILTVDHFFILSPCLSALRLSSHDWVLITVENIRPLIQNHDSLPPIVDEVKLEMIERLVDFQYSENGSRLLLSQNRGNGSVIHLHGPPGVGKRSMIELISLKFGRPLLTISPADLGILADIIEANLTRWLNISFIRALSFSKGVIFLKTGKIESINDTLHPLISLTVSLPELDDKTRNLIWSSLEKKLDAEKGIRLHQTAINFLGSSEARVVDWNGHEITRCFKIAIALAAKHTKHSQDSTVMVEDGHFKEAMNIVHASRRSRPQMPPMPSGPPLHMRRPATYSSEEDSSNSDGDIRRPRFVRSRVAYVEDVKDEDETDVEHTKSARVPLRQKKSSFEIPRRPVNLSSDSDLCIPDLNRVEWDAFRAAGGEELFRKTKFHAIDVLEGEPLIKLQVESQKRQRRHNSAQKSVYLNLARHRCRRESGLTLRRS
ncbi:hypothetical protein F5B21DRAFT_516499 [Xylaria acuta]|nr:hypothetical protein F5B21DRAFT_516499 [Xylaria acuta]